MFWTFDEKNNNNNTRIINVPFDMTNSKTNEIYESLLCLDTRIYDPGLLSGSAGIALALLYAHIATGNQKHKQKADEILEVLSEKICDCTVFSHCCGLAGIGWMFQHLCDKGWLQTDTNILLEDFDKLLPVIMQHHLFQSQIDFLHEATGIAYYFFSRYHDNQAAIKVLKYYMTKMYHIAERNDNIIKWETIIDHKKNRKGYNISLSHGMSSIVDMLNKLYSINDLENPRLKSMITNSINYILAQEIDAQKYGSFFPSIAIESSSEIHGSRLAWCYGDLGISMALYQAGKTLNRQDWIDKAVNVLLYAAEKRRDLSQNGVVDACFCHGTSGIAHIFYRMWWNTRLPEFKQATDYWIEQTLKMARFDDGLAGYKTWQGDDNGYQCSMGLLEGIAGIGLVLLSFYYEIEPTWDNCFLLS